MCAGTDATIAQHIQNIVDREYVIERMEGSTKYLVPSTLGVALVDGYDKIALDKSVSKPQLRREVRSLLSFIVLDYTPELIPLDGEEDGSSLRTHSFKTGYA